MNDYLRSTSSLITDVLRFTIAFLIGSGSQCTARSVPCQYGGPEIFSIDFPAGVFGIPQGIRRDLGAFTPPSFFLQCAITSSSAKDPPRRRTMRAFTASPQVSWGMPNHRALIHLRHGHDGCFDFTREHIETPEMIMSFLRSTM